MDDENASPHAGSLTSGNGNAGVASANNASISSSSGPNAPASTSAGAAAATTTTATSSLSGESSSSGSNVNTVRSVPGFGTLQQQPGMSTPAAAAAGQPNGIQQQQNGMTMGAKTLVTKRTRLSGLPPPSYSPLGAASPSLSSNAPSFPPNTPSSQPSSSQSTPSASPQSATTPLPPTGGVAYTSHQALPSHPPSTGAGSYSQQGAHSTTNAHLYPALHLHPLNETFIPKQISLYPSGPHNRIKIGRQTNAKTVPAPNNGYFDSKVLSRQHAEVWCENGKVYIKDVKSSNGTFINGERLSPEAVESDIFELHSNDMVEFGIDITSEDGKTIVHHKVAARCFLIMNAEDAVATSRNYASYYREMGDSPMHRRAGLGGQKPGNNVNLDQVLNRLQTELQKSRETGAELGTLTSTIGEIHETLGGNLPGPPLPAYRVPPYVPPNPNAPLPSQQAAQQAQQQAQTQQLLQTLQSQLQETQNALSGHVERIKGLEDLLGEQERMKLELKEVKDRMEESRSELERLRDAQQRSSIRNVSSVLEDDDDKEFDNDIEDEKEDEMVSSDSSDDMETIRLGAPQDESLPKDGNATVAAHGRDEVGGAKAEALLASQTKLEEENTALSSRMEALSSELSAASQLSSSLKNQYAQAAETIRGLEDKVNTLERALHAAPSAMQGDKRNASPSTEPKPSTSTGMEDVMREVENRFTDWKKSFEDSIKQERQSWEEERERFRNIVQDWEKRSSSLAQQQSPSASLKKKRRSKASTVSTSSDDDLSNEYSEDGASDPLEEGFVSPVTDDSGSPSRDQKRASVISKDFQATQNHDEASDMITSMPKRPRSRRRKRAPDATNTETTEMSSPSQSSQERRSQRPSMGQRTVADQSESGGSVLNRRRSWIPFSKSFTGNYPNNDAADGKANASIDREARKRRDAGVLDHPAFPFASAAGVVVISYLAYTAIVQHQK